MNLYDVIIIGGGPSGSTAASLLAEYGHKVLVLEKEKFPREHIGESLIPASYHTLKRLGVIEELKKISPRKPGVNFIHSSGKIQSLWCWKNVVQNESYLSFHVKRSLFDEMLLNNSRKKGAEVLEETLVKNVLLDREDKIVEVHTTDKNSAQKTYYANFLLDASGLNTFLGNKLGVKTAIKDLDRVAVWSHWTNVVYDTPLEEGAIKIVYLSGTDNKKGWCWVIPISKNDLSVGVVINNSYLKQKKEEYTKLGSTDWKHDMYINELNESPILKKLFENAKMAHKVQINGDYSYKCTQKYGDNYAMIGDAGAFLDPIFSSGIFVGMYSAELVADALHKKITENKDEAISAVYESINPAMELIEKFVKLFYSPEIIDFSDVGDTKAMLRFEQTEVMYTIFHYLISGDFFSNPKKYSDFIDGMLNQNVREKFKSLINHTIDNQKIYSCEETFEEMYGKVIAPIVYDKSLF